MKGDIVSIVSCLKSSIKTGRTTQHHTDKEAQPFEHGDTNCYNSTHIELRKQKLILKFPMVVLPDFVDEGAFTRR